MNRGKDYRPTSTTPSTASTTPSFVYAAAHSPARSVRSLSLSV